VSGLGTIFRRELRAYVDSPIGFVFLLVFSVITCSLFTGSFFLAERADLRGLFGLFPQVMVVFVPAITMRLWAEDHRQGTSELLLTLPIPARWVVLGKFFAGVAFLTLALATTLPAVVSVALLGDLDPGPVVGGYLGALVLGCFYLALGLFASGLCRDQVVAFILAFLLSFALYLLGTDLIALQLDAWTGDLGSFLRRYVGLAVRFEAIERGVIDTRDLLYFALGTGTFLTLDGIWIKVRMQPRAGRSMAHAMLLLLPLWLLAMMVIEPIGLGRFDLTEDRLYTVSPASREMLSKLDAPLRATLYVSPQDRMPAGMKTLRRDVEDLLEELGRVAGGRLETSVVVIDPQALRPEEQEKLPAVSEEDAEPTDADSLSEEEELAERLLKDGVRPFEVRSVEADGFGVALVYSALVLSYKDRAEQVIPRIRPAMLPVLEYEVMMRVDRLQRLGKPKVALVAPVERQPVEPALAKVYRDMGKPVPDRRTDHYATLQKALKRLEFQVHRLERFGEDRPLPDDADLIIVPSPDQWSERQVYELNAALRRGQPVLLATQRYSFVYRPFRGRYKVSAELTGTGVDRLLTACGTPLGQEWLMDRSSEAITIMGTSMMAQQAQRPAPVEMDTHILVPASGMNDTVAVTNRLGRLLMMWASPLHVDIERTEAAGLKATELLHSSAESWLVPAHVGNIVNNDVQPPETFDGPQTMAVLLEGTFPDAFGTMHVPGWVAGEAGEALPEMTGEAVPTRMMVIGCDQLLRDRFITSADNGRFVLNAVDSLALGDTLVSIRGKQPVNRRIERVSARVRTAHRVAVVGAVPLLIALLGLLRVLSVQRAKERYRTSLARRGEGNP
jgi:ABC-2 type transport system permease protein